MPREPEHVLLEKIQKVVRASDSEVAAKVGLSTETYRRAKKGEAPLETTRSFFPGLASLRNEFREALDNVEIPAAG